MKRTELTLGETSLLDAAEKLARQLNVDVVLVLTDRPCDFRKIAQELKKVRLVVASGSDDVQQAATEDEIDFVPLINEPQTRQVQLSQSLLEAIADDLMQTGSRIIAVYPGYERENLDSLSVINLSEHLAKLTTRDLQRLETQVPLETLRRVVDLAVEIGREGREGSSVGTIFTVGHHRKVLEMSHEQVHDPFKGYNKSERSIRSARVRESIKELSQIDGAFVIASDGTVVSAGRILDGRADNLTLSKGLGARHWACAAISKATKTIAISVSQSTGTVRLFHDGHVVLRIEPMDQAMKWQDIDTEPPSE
ncbi:MAG: diadenylate cyclase [Planctomycetaceae bacterium]|nr:diadenylate cyclase [Planctomycetaceae bacterium]MCA9108672.1 diadenylate cyclase [Planctomycetaceae bacterium]